MQLPDRDALALLDWIMSRGVHEYLDVAGRPVGEGRSDAFRIVHTELHACPYPGSRNNHVKPMNVTALRQMPSWPQILTMLHWLSQRYRARKGGKVVTSDDLAQVTSSGIFLIDYLVLRRHRPLRSGETPTLVSGLYKVCLGFQLAYLPERFAGQPTTAGLPDARGFYAYLEENELLIGEAEVCSGSAAMIMQAYEAIIGGRTIAKADLPPPCTELEIDWDAFDAFAQHTASIWRELVFYLTHEPEFYPRLKDSRLPPEIERRLNEYLGARTVEIATEQRGLVAEIARAALEYNGPPIAISAGLRPRYNASRGGAGFAATVARWLAEQAKSEMQAHSAIVSEALEAQLWLYDRYRGEVLSSLEAHLAGLLRALDFSGTVRPLDEAAFSRACGRALCDWYPS